MVFLAMDLLPVLAFADRPIRAQQFNELVPLALANVIDDRRLSLSLSRRSPTHWPSRTERRRA